MATQEKEAKLLDAIGRLDTLLLAVKSKHPDFGFLWAKDLMLQQAHCWLSLAKIRRLNVVKSSPPGRWTLHVDVGASESSPRSISECLVNARKIFSDPEFGKSKGFAQGQVAVLIEEAELLVMQGLAAEAFVSLDEAIQLCSTTGDLAAEGLVTSKMEALRLELDTWARLDELTNDPQENASEREILAQCFRQLASQDNPSGVPVLRKDQLRILAHELGVQTLLQEDEEDEVWRQMVAVRPPGDPKSGTDTGLSFANLWRWWMSEEMFEFRSQRRQKRV